MILRLPHDFFHPDPHADPADRLFESMMEREGAPGVVVLLYVMQAICGSPGGEARIPMRTATTALRLRRQRFMECLRFIGEQTGNDFKIISRSSAAVLQVRWDSFHMEQQNHWKAEIARNKRKKKTVANLENDQRARAPVFSSSSSSSSSLEQEKKKEKRARPIPANGAMQPASESTIAALSKGAS